MTRSTPHPTREPSRAARALLNLRQDQLANLADVGVVTLRRCEGGKEFGPSQLDALRVASEEAGAIILDAEEAPGGPARDATPSASGGDG